VGHRRAAAPNPAAGRRGAATTCHISVDINKCATSGGTAAAVVWRRQWSRLACR